MNTREEIEARARVEMRKAEATMKLLANVPTDLIERCSEVERRYARALETYKQRKVEYDAMMDEVRDFASISSRVFITLLSSRQPICPLTNMLFTIQNAALVFFVHIDRELYHPCNLHHTTL